jgi:hypothetical protein
MGSGPWYSSVAGGIVNHASPVSSATTPSTSPSANAAANRAATSRSFKERGNGTRSRSRPGSGRFHGGPRPLQRAVHRSLAEVQNLGNLIRGSQARSAAPAPPVAEAVVSVYRRDEGQRDRLLGLISRFRVNSEVRHVFQQRIRIG